MNSKIQEILAKVYDLEGILHVLDRKRGEAPEVLFEMARSRMEFLANLAPMCKPEMFAHEKDCISEPVTPDTHEECNCDDCEDIYNAEHIVEVGDEPHDDAIQEPSPSHDEFVDEEPLDEDIFHDDGFDFVDEEREDSVFVDSNEEVVDDYPLFADEPKEEVSLTDDFVEDIESIDEEAYTEEYEEKQEPVAVNDDDADAEEEEDIEDLPIEEIITVEEVLHRSISKNLSKAFSLNDHFRYRRELFGNSEMEMRNAINMVEAMHSFAEAEEYFYGDLEWDAESPEVADFMVIIRNHFL